jgi:hypothetical protein
LYNISLKLDYKYNFKRRINDRSDNEGVFQKSYKANDNIVKNNEAISKNIVSDPKSYGKATVAVGLAEASLGAVGIISGARRAYVDATQNNKGTQVAIKVAITNRAVEDRTTAARSQGYIDMAKSVKKALTPDPTYKPKLMPRGCDR